MNELDIAVVGGSLGGLTAACLLRDQGHRVTIYERSATPLEERGAGIGFLPATARYLAERAAVDLDDISITTSTIRHLARDGSTASEQTHRYRFSSWNTVYRSLLAHWRADAHDGDAGDGDDGYRFDHELTTFRVDDADDAAEVGIAAAGRASTGPVSLSFANGATATCDLLVCADGVGSTGRAVLQPATEPAYAGYVAWRGMVPERALGASTAALLGDAITYHVYANSHILIYPIPAADGSITPGERLINVVWYRNYTEGDDLTSLLTDASGTVRTLSVPPGHVAPVHAAEARAVAQARLPGPMAEVVAATEELFVQVVYDIEVDRMAFGPVCLLGDAAFAVRPHAAAGTAKAAEDGWKLAEALAAAVGSEGRIDIGAATRTWEQGQLALGRSLLERTRAVGARSQVDNTWQAGDPDLIFGLYRPGD